MNGSDVMTDFETWLHDNGDRIYRYWIYKRMFTPEEMDKKWSDQSCYENDECFYGIIREAIELPDGDILLGFVDPEAVGTDVENYINYYKLSQIDLVFDPTDAKEFLEDE